MKSFVEAFAILCFFCQIAFGQTEKPKAAVYIVGNPEGRDILRMSVHNFLVNSGRYRMIDIDAIDVVVKEHTRQHSGSVSDADVADLGKDAGAKYVCVVERTEFDRRSYISTRIVNVESKVARLSELSELPKGGSIINVIEKQISSMLNRTATDANNQRRL